MLTLDVGMKLPHQKRNRAI